MILGESKFLKLAETFVRLQCQNEKCQKIFYSSRPAQSKFCSQSCRQSAYIQRIKDGQTMDEIETDQTKDSSSTNNQSEDIMNDDMKELLRLTHENAALQGQIALLQKESENAEYHRNEAESLRGLVGRKDTQMRALTSDMDRTINENKQLRMQVSELTDENEDLQEKSQETGENNMLFDNEIDALAEENDKLKNENKVLTEDLKELKWGCLTLQGNGMPSLEGAKIPMDLVLKWFGSEYPLDNSWDVKIWGWHLKHIAAATEVLITKIVK
jgi:chromosome segregation ATPase